ncbi:fungal hydrophobin-domain-containing protein [Panaeolus papilionaceus]|nr:fungal hydrophobin-domain-containing protein [Panaeolus papilionaceus]
MIKLPFYSALFSLAAATTTVTVTYAPHPLPVPYSQCPTGWAQCCSSVELPSGPQASLLLGLLDLAVTPYWALVGITCTPVTIIGISPSSCTAQILCCEHNDYNGILAIGCAPMDISF